MTSTGNNPPPDLADEVAEFLLRGETLKALLPKVELLISEALTVAQQHYDMKVKNEDVGHLRFAAIECRGVIEEYKEKSSEAGSKDIQQG